MHGPDETKWFIDPSQSETLWKPDLVCMADRSELWWIPRWKQQLWLMTIGGMWGVKKKKSMQYQIISTSTNFIWLSMQPAASHRVWEDLYCMHAYRSICRYVYHQMEFINHRLPHASSNDTHQGKDLSHGQRHRGQQKTSCIFLNICQFVSVQHVQIKKKKLKKAIYIDILLAPVLISFRPRTALAAFV